MMDSEGHIDETVLAGRRTISIHYDDAKLCVHLGTFEFKDAVVEVTVTLKLGRAADRINDIALKAAKQALLPGKRVGRSTVLGGFIEVEARRA